MNRTKPKILVILGPTASGKSDLAVRLAKKYNGEVISADSRQVYTGLDIGTGKITRTEMKGVEHHLLDVADPKKQFTVVDYQKLAQKAIEGILSREKLPIICGGTGFYIEALIDGVIMPDVPPNKALRKKLENKKSDQLLVILKKLDPKRAQAMSENSSDRNNLRRIIRAIEIATALGKVPAIQNTPSPYDPTIIGIKVETSLLRERILKRLITRINDGMITEAKRLHSQGLSWKRMDSLGLEYRYLALFLQNKMTKEEMTEKLFHAICQYSKRQMTWFKRDKRIKWIDFNKIKKANPLQ